MDIRSAGTVIFDTAFMQDGFNVPDAEAAVSQAISLK